MFIFITMLLDGIKSNESENECCSICNDIITNEFGVLNCTCKTIFFHNKCLNLWLSKSVEYNCPQCSKKFNKKPIKFNKKKYDQKYLFILSYNCLRVMSGMPPISY